MGNPGRAHWVCERCGVVVSNLGRHIRRGRCGAQHRRSLNVKRGRQGSKKAKVKL